MEAELVAVRKRASRVHIGERNDHGGVPEDNRDAMGHASLLAGHLLVLASGVGGTRGGRVEGNLAVSAVLTHFRTAADNSMQTRLDASLARANEVLHSRAARDPALQGTGAACAAVLVEDGRCYAARTGAVRIFVVRGELAEELLASPEDDRVGPEVAAQAAGVLGAGPHFMQLGTTEPLFMVQGDRIVVAGPGLHRFVSGADIARIAASAVPQVASGRLIDTARQRGARGGVSVQVLQWDEPRAESVSAPVSGLRLPDALRLGETQRPAADVSPPARPHVAASLVTRTAVPLSEPTSERAAHRRSVTPPTAVPVSFPRNDRSDRNVDTAMDLDFEESFALPGHGPSASLLGRLLKDPSPAAQRWAVPVAAAMFAAGALWLWSPWKAPSDPAQSETPTHTAATSEESPPTPEEQAAMARSLGESSAIGVGGRNFETGSDWPDDEPLPPRAPEAPDVAAAPGPPLPAALIPSLAARSDTPPPSSVPAAAPAGARAPVAGFWAEVGRAVGEGEPISPSDIESWLQLESAGGGALADRAKARLAELRAVESALQGLLSPNVALSAQDERALDRVFRGDSAAMARNLKKFIESEYEIRKDEAFSVVEAYLTKHRSPEAIAALLELSRGRTGPRTRTWLDTRMSGLLAGQ